MFNDAYKGANPSEHPKYGCFNLSGDIEGCASARSYGRCFLTLDPSVRDRCTLWNRGDKNQNDVQVATPKYCAHLLHQYSILEDLLYMCTHWLWDTPFWISHHEVHIHGPIDLSRDIQALSMPGRYKDASFKTLWNVRQFQKKTGCNVFWQQDQLDGQRL